MLYLATPCVLGGFRANPGSKAEITGGRHRRRLIFRGRAGNDKCASRNVNVNNRPANTNANIGTKFPSGFEDKYRYVGSVVTRTNGYIRRRLPNTPLSASQGATYSKGECGYGYMANYWGSAGKKTRVGVRSGYNASSGYLSARSLNAYSSAGSTISYFCGSAQVLLDVN